MSILTDKLGVDFGIYVKEIVMSRVREHWYAFITEAAKNKTGKVVIEFSILKDGSVSGIKLGEYS